MNIAQALAEAASFGLDRLDAQLLLLQALRRPSADRAWLVAHDTDPIPDAQQQQFAALCGRRAGGEPLAYIAGRREFFGLALAVDPRVLVPRPDTETLVEWALEVLADTPVPRVIDLGTGSGAIALAIKSRRPDAQVIATDHSAHALEVASANAKSLDLEIEFRRASWLTGLQERFHLIASNPPYIAAGDPHLAALGHEPLDALVAGPDGLADLRTIIAQALPRLEPRGWVLLEHGWDQAEAVRDLLVAAGLRGVGSRHDLAGIARCSGGQRPELG